MPTNISPFKIDLCKDCGARYSCPMSHLTKKELAGTAAKVRRFAALHNILNVWRDDMLSVIFQNWDLELMKRHEINGVKMQCIHGYAGTGNTPTFKVNILVEKAMNNELWPEDN